MDYNFKPGDKVLRVTRSGWDSMETLIAVDTVAKVHKTGKVILEALPSVQWRQNGDPVGSMSTRFTAIEPYTDARRSELAAAKRAREDRDRLRTLGRILSNYRDDESASFIWAALPDSVKALIEPGAERGM